MPPSLRETLEAAAAGEGLDAGTDAAAPEVVAAPEAASLSAPSNEAANLNTAPAAQPANPAAAPVRDASGRFAPKAGDAPLTPSTEPVAPAAAEPQPEAIRVPASLPASLKADFQKLPQEWRDAISNLEGSVQTAKGEWASKGQRLNRYEEIVAPRRERIALHGVDEFTWLQRLAAAEDVLDKDPIAGLTHLARLYGVSLGQIAGQTNGQMAAQPHVDPVLQQLHGQVQTLQTQLQQRTQAEEEARQSEAKSEIDQFRNDPKNLYFDNVSGEVAAILKAGQANTLQEAYDKAIWASPTIRPLLLKEQTAQAERDRQTADRAKAQAAQRASGSVTGAPGSAGAPGQTGSKGSIRADLEAARASLGGRV